MLTITPRFRSLLALLLIVLAWPLAQAQAQVILKPGDRIVFYGDSITEQRLYTRYIQQYLLSRYPDLKLVFFNAGWGGDTAPGGANRLERDVLTLQPTVVTLFFGMNDGHYAPVNESVVKTYRDGLDKIITTLQAKGVKVIVFTPGCVDPDRQKHLGEVNYNKTLETLAQTVLDLAKEHNCPSVDVFHPMLAFQTAQKAKNPSYTMIPDSVHPNAVGHEVMANLMLKSFGAESMPALGTVDLAANTQEGLKVVSNQDGRVVLETTGPTLLPYWFEPGLASDMEASGVLGFAGRKLTVQGLAKGTYEVRDDHDAQLGRFTAQALAQGIMISGTTSAKGKLLHDWIMRKENNYFSAWREVRLASGMPPALNAIYANLLAADTGYAQLVQDLAQPLPMLKFAIIAVPEGINLALHKSYVCSDPNKYGWNNGLTDGSWVMDSSGCFASGDDATFPKTVTVDLEQVVTCNTVVLGVPPFGSTKTITVAVSADGKDFQEVGSYVFTLRKEEKYTYKFKPVQARYVRLTYPDHYSDVAGYPATFVFTVELEVYGPNK